MKITASFALLLGALVATSAQAQATRIWISGVGDDTNPCSRTAPCKTIASSLAKVAAGGEIDLLDPVDVGPFTITKALTIDGRAALGGLQAPNVSGVVVNAGPNDAVTLRGLTLEALQSGTSGVQFVAGKALHVEQCTINSFTSAGVDFSPAAGGALFVLKSIMRGSDVGVRVESSHGRALATLSRVTLEGNSRGLAVGAGGLVTGVALRVMQNSTAGIWLSTDGGVGEVNVEGASITDNPLGVRAEAPVGQATIRLSNALVSGSSISPTQAAGGGIVHSFGNNRIIGGSYWGCGADAGVSVGPASFPGGVAGVAYASTELISTGAMGETSWAAQGGLPDGLSILDGVVVGTPVKAGHFPFTLALTDGNGCAASEAAAIDVVCPALILSPSAVAATTGAALSSTFTLAGTASTQRTWALTGTLPIGVSFADGVLSGVPTQGGAFPLSLSVTDGFGCVASLSPTLTVALAAGYQATTLALVASPNPNPIGFPVTLTATISGATSPTGTVEFFEGTTSLFSAPVSNGVATVSTPSFPLGTHTLTAVYSGDAVAGGSLAPAIEVVIERLATSTTLAALGGGVYQATVTSDAGVAGLVALSVDGLDGGEALLDGAGQASFTVDLAVGDHQLIASYEGSSLFAPSTSAPLTVQIAAPVDAGTDAGVDAGIAADAGSGVDAGDGTDAGTTPTPGKTGCGCGTTDGSVPMLGLILLALWRRRG